MKPCWHQFIGRSLFYPHESFLVNGFVKFFKGELFFRCEKPDDKVKRKKKGGRENKREREKGGGGEKYPLNCKWLLEHIRSLTRFVKVSVIQIGMLIRVLMLKVKGFKSVEQVSLFRIEIKFRCREIRCYMKRGHSTSVQSIFVPR